jgi:hypothetical protein
MKKTPVLFTLAILLTLSLGTTAHASMEVRSEFSPPVISLGSHSEYQLIIVNGTGDPSGKIPAVEGLELNSSPSISSKFNFINGRQSAEKTYAFQVTPRKEGEYVFPSWEVTIEGEKFTVPSATLKVVPPGKEFNDAISLKLLPEKAEAYVGETIAAVVKLYVRGDVSARLQNRIEKHGDAFTQSEIPDEFQQKKEQLQGQWYKVAAWPMTLTPLKPGEHKVFYTLENVLVDLPSNDRRQRSPFGFNSFFDDAFGNGNRKQVTMTSKEVVFNIKEIPTQGRLEGFTGAVGNFMSSTTLDLNTVKAGEPITLSIELTGEGNFDRVIAPEIKENDDFKIYPPKSHFEASHDTGLRGKKRFEYILIPKHSEITETPVIPFSFFDPKTESFQDISAPAIPITVTGQKKISNPILPTQPEDFLNNKPNDEKPVNNKNPIENMAIYPNQQELGSISHGIKAPVYRPSFWLTQSLCGLVALSLFLVGQNLSRKNNEKYQLAKKYAQLKKEELNKLSQAKKTNNTLDFFTAAEKVLQYSVAQKYPDHTPNSIQLNNIKQILLGKQLDSEKIQDAIDILETSQKIRFSGGFAKTDALSIWDQKLQQFISKL